MRHHVRSVSGSRAVGVRWSCGTDAECGEWQVFRGVRTLPPGVRTHPPAGRSDTPPGRSDTPHGRAFGHPPRQGVRWGRGGARLCSYSPKCLCSCTLNVGDGRGELGEIHAGGLGRCRVQLAAWGFLGLMPPLPCARFGVRQRCRPRPCCRCVLAGCCATPSRYAQPAARAAAIPVGGVSAAAPLACSVSGGRAPNTPSQPAAPVIALNSPSVKHPQLPPPISAIKAP